MTMAACPGCQTTTGRHNFVPGSCEHATDALGYADPVPPEKDDRIWPDDFRGWGSNVLTKRVKRSTR